MIFNLIAEAVETDATNGLTTGALVGLIICGVIVVGIAIFGIVLCARGLEMKYKQNKRRKKHSEAPPVLEEKHEEKHEDFTHLTKDEKDLIREYRHQMRKFDE